MGMCQGMCTFYREEEPLILKNTDSRSDFCSKEKKNETTLLDLRLRSAFRCWRLQVAFISLKEH